MRNTRACDRRGNRTARIGGKFYAVAKVRYARLLGCLTLLAGASSCGGKQPRIVLGAKLGGPRYSCYVNPDSCGWGTAAPKNFSLGGDPSGTISGIRWEGWGKSTATGHGLHAIFGPGGDGYYHKLARIELRAYDIGRCPDSRQIAYRRMIVREPSRPGGPLGRWHGFSVTGTTSTCSGRLPARR